MTKQELELIKEIYFNTEAIRSFLKEHKGYTDAIEDQYIKQAKAFFEETKEQLKKLMAS